MRWTICLICIVAVVASFCGCGNNDTDYTRPVNLYYCTDTVDYKSTESVFAYETRDLYGWSERLLDFLNVYLTGPKKNGLVSPFPIGASINSLHTNGSCINVQLSNHFSRLSTNELTLACACLSMTILGITNGETVNIQIDDYGDGNTNITMTRENLHLTDTPNPEE